MRKDEGAIILEVTYNASIETVWKSLTEIDLMRQWYFDMIPDFIPEVGFETQFIIEHEGRTFLHMWRVIEALPPRKIAYDWQFDGYAGESVSRFELFDENSRTRLKLTVEVLEDFPDDIPEFTRESCLGGWEYFLKGRLKEFLEEK